MLKYFYNLVSGYRFMLCFFRICDNKTEHEYSCNIAQHSNNEVFLLFFFDISVLQKYYIYGFV
jgi:hypothetical protein